MRLKLILSLAIILAISCQPNSTNVQDSSSDKLEISNSLTQDEKKAEFKNLHLMIEKVFVKESDIKTRAKMVSKFFLKSNLSEKEKNVILKRVMKKSDFSPEDTKEFLQTLSLSRRMKSKKLNF